MRLTTSLLGLAAIASAVVIPDEQIAQQLRLEPHTAPTPFLHRFRGDVEGLVNHVESAVQDAVAFSENAIDHAIHAAQDMGAQAGAAFQCYGSMLAFDAQGWLESAASTVEGLDLFDVDHPHEKPHRPHHPPHRGPHHGHQPNQTVYELIASSKYTTRLAALINEFPDLVEVLNGTAANYTVFAPTNTAFERIPDHHGKPAKELIKKVLAYHVSPEFYPAGRVLVSHTIPTALGEEALGGEPQRLRVGLGLRGLAVNFYSRVVAVNIFGTNGVIHGVDHLILPPPPAHKIISLLPGEFSTLQLALTKTGLDKVIANGPHVGGTLFAPSNFAFKKLGPRINAFLFSSYGEKYLAALLRYHVVANQTLYSDAFYRAKSESDAAAAYSDVRSAGIPKGYFHVDLPTLLDDKSLSVDIARYGALISIKINGFSRVAVQDGVAKDGVIQVLSSVLIPPKTPGGASELEDDEEEGELDLEDFKERLLPWVGEL